jgi:ABC-type phosphate transport system substrate-binding protein
MCPSRALVVLLAAVTLAGCSGGKTPGASATPTGTPSHTANVADVAYLAAVRPSIQGSTDADLIALGHKACTSFAESGAATQLQVVEEFTGLGFSSAAAAAITTAAVTSYCPEYKDNLATP